MFGLGGGIDFRKGSDSKDKGKPGADKSVKDEGSGDGGDGKHHHTIHETDSGYSSSHTDPDGSQEDADHADMDDAKAHMDAKFGGDQGSDEDEGSGTDDVSGMSDDCGPDLSGAYSKD